MNRLAPALAILALALTSCSFGLSGGSQGDTEATVNARVNVSVAKTMAALPKSTPLPTQPLQQPQIVVLATSTATGTVTPTPSLTATSGTSTPTVTGTLSATPTFTATSGTVTGTLPAASITPTDLMVTREYGTQPPFIAYGKVKLVNQAHTQVYISFQCVTPDGIESITETPVTGTNTISVAAGNCFYVAWVGGVEYTGNVHIEKSGLVTFTFKSGSIIIH